MRKAYAIDSEIAKSYKNGLVNTICSDSGAWLKCYRVESSNCQKISESLVDACFDQLVVKRIDPVTNEVEVRAVSDKILSCIRRSFKNQYGDKIGGPECQDVY